jgi:diamine N-acetyltransferase
MNENAVPSIRELRSEEDLPGCVDLLRAAFGTVARDFGLTEETAPTNAAFTTIENLQRHLRSGMSLYGMFSAASLVGCVAIKRSKADESVFFVERLAVAPEKRCQGNGGRLLSFAVELIRRSGGRCASIGVMDTNHRLKKWYTSRGFVRHDTRRIAHLPFKVCFMSMDLGNGTLTPAGTHVALFCGRTAVEVRPKTATDLFHPGRLRGDDLGNLGVKGIPGT